MSTTLTAENALQTILNARDEIAPVQRGENSFIPANDDDIDKWWPEHKLDEVRTALMFVDADDRDVWIDIGLALKGWAGGDGFKIWDEWSQQSPKYKPGEMQKRWDSFLPTSIGIGSVFYHAQEGLEAVFPEKLDPGEAFAFIDKYELNKCPQLLKLVDKRVELKPKQTGFRLIPSTELTARPNRPNWLIKDLFEQGTLITLFAPPASYKSFVALNMAFCIATGTDWHGKQVVDGHVIYIAGEGHGGLGRRIRALETHYGTQADRLIISTGSMQLMSVEITQEVIDAITAICPNPKLIIIDTLNRNMGDGDENSATDIAKLLTNMDAMRVATGAAAMLVHHTGKSNIQSPRGSSAIRAAMDAEFSVTKNGNMLEMKCTKSKDHDEPAPMCFETKQVDTGWTDEDGLPITSLVIETARTIIKAKLSGYEQVALGLLNALITIPNATVLLDDWRKECVRQWMVDAPDVAPDSLRKRFTRVQGALVDKGLLELQGEEINIKQNVWH